MSMRTRMAIAVGLIVGMSSSAAAQRGTPDPDRAAVRQVVLELAANMQDAKWPQADSAFAARGLHILVDTVALHSWAEYRDTRLKPEIARLSALKVAHTAIESVVRGGNVAWTAFRQEFSGTPSSGAAKVVTRASAVLEKVDGRWIIVHLHISK